MPFSARVVRFCSRHAQVVVAICAIVCSAAAFYALTHFAMDNNSEDLLSTNLSWRQTELAYDAAFPQENNLTLVTVDGVTAERAEQAAAALTAALKAEPHSFVSVRRPDDGSFFAHNGLLFLPLSDVQNTTQQLISAQPLLGALAADPSLRGIMTSLSTALMGVANGQVKLDEISRPFAPLSTTLDSVLAGKTSFLGWRTLISGAPPSRRETRRFIEVLPVLNYSSLQPGAAATKVIRAAVRRLALTPENGVTVRLTGQIPMADEEFATLTQHVGLLGAATGLGMLTMMWFAVRSLRLLFAIVVTVLAGLFATAAFGLLTVGRFNIISVAFIILYVGLGIDFCIQFCVRYRAERHAVQDLETALVRTGGSIGRALTLAALALAAGFFAFMPTSYVGVAELGLIAGGGMILSFVLSLTLLPALVRLLNPPGEPEAIGFVWLAPLDRLVIRRCGLFVGAGIGLGVVGAVLVPFLHFDANPLDLRSPKVESVATAIDLMKDPETSPNTINVLTPSRQAAALLAQQLARLPEVLQTRTIDSFIPEQQTEKRAVITDAAMLLDPTLNPFAVAPPPSDAEIIGSMKDAGEALHMAAATEMGAPAEQARRLAAQFEQLAATGPAARVRATAALVSGLNTMLEQTRAAMQPQPVSFETLPGDLVRDWVSPKGEFRVEAFPKVDSNDVHVLAPFINAVRAASPQATGTPIVIEESGRTIVNAFIEAGVLSFLTIALLLYGVQRRLRDLALALGPLVLAGVLTLATCVVARISLNYANIIALPLLFGIGVAFDIYFVTAWCSGQRGLLASPLARAVILSAGTTASAFGTLSLSNHPGTASMGKLLLISLAWILASVLLFLPALLEKTVPKACD